MIDWHEGEARSVKVSRRRLHVGEGVCGWGVFGDMRWLLVVQDEMHDSDSIID
jgi:hypothetical protein